MPVPEYDGKNAAVDLSASAVDAVEYGSLKGKSVVVTGGAGGLGEAMTRRFVDAGAFVTIADINEERGARISKGLKGNSQFVKCDVTSWEDQVAMFKAAVSKSPQNSCDIVVANAGIGGPDQFFVSDDGEEPTKPDLKMTQVDQIGVMYTAKLAFHHFNKQPETKERERCLILSGSFAAFVDVPNFVQYSMAKYSLRGLMRSLRRTSWVNGIRVNLIAPWFIETPTMLDFHKELLKKGGIEYALAEDAATATLRIAADKSVHGRSLAVVPRKMTPAGYTDMKQDDYEDGTFMGDLQQAIVTLHKRLAADQGKAK